ncbi:MAG: 1-(5-phosphoribosyl)-5-[(5-phosphoribosylamino)methylideneamino]imidazole-4-carboxamide isomerase [Chloroflexi bacterium]|nr:1-(5-phosphoribosyl)-5-[(5-phosphoribosylamino)methylideneamino]imidazole-4-carboxamide isomerase [Chloroflexota bacterium]
MEVIPAIDIRGGRCVRLSQGDYERETVFDDDPLAVAVRWAALGARRIHIVDLDGAREGQQVNAALVRRIVRTVDAAVQTGGGLRDLATVRAALDDGVNRVVLGTAAVRDPDLLREAVAVARARLIVSVDARNGVVQLQGWTEGSDVTATSLIRQLASIGVERIVYTDIDRDGVRGSPNFEMYEALVSETSIAVIAAGGVSSLDDLRRLSDCGVEAAIVGRALYTGEVALPEALAVS